jgi:hypothetical protein
MIRRALFLIFFAMQLRADTAREIHDFLLTAATALRDGNAYGFMGAFDPNMKGYQQLRAQTVSLVHDAQVDSTIKIKSNNGSDTVRTLELDWQLQIAEKDSSAGSTDRRGNVTCRVEKIEGKWLIESFDPLLFFTPPRGREAWDTVSAALRGLQENKSALVPGFLRATTVTVFLSYFDRDAAGYDQLRANVTALVNVYDLESSMTLLSNTGDDRTRSIEVDWILTLTDPVGDVASAKREKKVIFRVAKQGKKWKIESFAPTDIVAPKS